MGHGLGGQDVGGDGFPQSRRGEEGMMKLWHARYVRCGLEDGGCIGRRRFI